MFSVIGLCKAPFTVKNVLHYYNSFGSKYSLDTYAVVNDSQKAEFEFKGLSNSSFELGAVEDGKNADATVELFFDSAEKQSFFLNKTS